MLIWGDVTDNHASPALEWLAFPWRWLVNRWKTKAHQKSLRTLEERLNPERW